jgi:hypothetical protein
MTDEEKGRLWKDKLAFEDEIVTILKKYNFLRDDTDNVISKVIIEIGDHLPEVTVTLGLPEKPKKEI